MVTEKIVKAAHAYVVDENPRSVAFDAFIAGVKYALAAEPSETAAGDAARIADALELCDWSGCSIGNKAILKAAVAALRSTRPTGEGVKVKPLEWELDGDGTHLAKSSIGPYIIWPGKGFSYDLSAPVGGRIGTHKRIAAAKAAAQADYGERILSALASPSPAPEAEPVGYCVWINGKLAGCAKSHKGAFPVFTRPTPAVDADAVIEALERIRDLTPAKANARTADDLYASVKAIAATVLASLPPSAGKPAAQAEQREE